MSLSAEDHRLFDALQLNNADATAAALQQAIREGASVNAFRDDRTPLMIACIHGYDEIVRILLDAGADATLTNRCHSAISIACESGHLSIVQLLINHDNLLLEKTNSFGWTPLFWAIRQQNSDLVRLLLDCGADAHHVGRFGSIALMNACRQSNLEVVRLLLAAGADVETRDWRQQTALHNAADSGEIEVMRELILQHNANMFAVNKYGRRPFDLACDSRRDASIDRLLEIYGNKSTEDHGRLALHELLKVAKYSFAEDEGFRPPLNPLQVILPLGKLTLKHLRTLLHTLDPDMIRNRDDTGKLPIHIACQTNAPVDVLALILELDPTTLRIADSTGALPIHLLCGSTAATEHASVRYLVEQGGVGTLAARNRQGLLPLHVLCTSTNPSLRAVQFLIYSFPVSLAMRTNAGQYPFMMAASDSASASLSVVYELVRASPDLVIQR